MPGIEIWAGTVCAEHNGEVGATDAECVGGVGGTNAERVSPRHEGSEAILEM